MVPKAKAFGLTVITHDPYVSKDVLASAGVEGVSFDDLLARSDFVSVHAPLMPATRGLVNAAAFAKMKKGALLINTARGPLIDEPALIAALDSGQLGGAALDVVTTEPLAKDSPLLGRDNVILTPHTAFYSVEALDRAADQMRDRRRARAVGREAGLSGQSVTVISPGPRSRSPSPPCC